MGGQAGMITPITTMTPDSTTETVATDADPAAPFEALVERFVRQRGIETPLTKPPNARRAAESTFQAMLYVLRKYGIARIDDQWMWPRLADFSTAQLKELIAAMERMQPRYRRTITDELLSTLKDYYDVATKR
jgi:hypothetical protein